MPVISSVIVQIKSHGYSVPDAAQSLAVSSVYVLMGLTCVFGGGSGCRLFLFN